MTKAGRFILAADFTGRGSFDLIGELVAPSLALAAAIAELRAAYIDPALRDAPFYPLAASISGRCILANEDFESLLLDCLEARLVMDWRLTIPDAGELLGLYVIANFWKAGAGLPGHHIDLRLAGQPLFSPPRAQEKDG